MCIIMDQIGTIRDPFWCKAALGGGHVQLGCTDNPKTVLTRVAILPAFAFAASTRWPELFSHPAPFKI